LLQIWRWSLLLYTWCRVINFIGYHIKTHIITWPRSWKFATRWKSTRYMTMLFSWVCFIFLWQGIQMYGCNLSLRIAWLNGMIWSKIFLKIVSLSLRLIRCRQEITSFQKDYEEQLSQSWERFKELLKKTPMHEFDDPTQINIFIGELRAQTKLILYIFLNWRHDQVQDTYRSQTWLWMITRCRMSAHNIRSRET